MRLPKYFFFATMICMSGCATLPALIPIPSSQIILDQIQARRQTIQGLKGLANLKVSAKDKNFSTSQIFLVRQPAFLRAETLSPLGIPQLYFVTDGEKLNIYHVGENRFYIGPATAQYLSYIFPLSLKPEEVVPMLLASPPLIEYETASVRDDAEDRAWVLELISTARGEKESLWVHPKDFRVTQAEFQGMGKSWRVKFSSFQKDRDLHFPYQIEIIQAEEKVQISIEYREIEFNPVWESADFQLPVPAGAEIIRWK
jgi:outer membrane lipoprotein-sorting protein